MFEKLKAYTQLKGASGDEKLVKEELFKTFSKNDFTIFDDNLGGIAVKISGKKKKKIGIFAHMDEVALMVGSITEDGLINIVPVGGINSSFLVSQRVVLRTNSKNFTGVISSPSPHLKKEEALKLGDLKINFGFKDKKDALESGVKLGQYMYIEGEIEKLSNKNIVSKALDNRLGCAVLDELFEIYAKKNNEFDLYLGATVQEEIGLKGANILLNALDEKLDEIIVIDVSPIDEMKEYELGNGPLIRISEKRTIFSKKMNKKIMDIADRNNLKYQLYNAIGGVDGRAMQLHGSGQVVTALCIGGINLHTNSSIVNLNDIDELIKILKAYLKE